MVSVAIILHAAPREQHSEDKPDRPLTHHDDDVARGRRELFDGFEAGIHGLNERGDIEGNSIGNFLDPALDDPIHDAHILRKTTARWFKTRRNTHALIDEHIAHKDCDRSRSTYRTGYGGTR